MAKLISTNPADNYTELGSVEISTDEEIQKRVKQANNAKSEWKDIGIKKRIGFLKPIYEEFENKKDEIAQLITKEIGKPINESISETNGAFSAFKWYLNEAENAISDQITYKDENSLHKVRYEPFGVCAIITPWNFPLYGPLSDIISNLIVGNSVVLKVSEECPLMGKLIESVFSKSALPDGVFSEIYGVGDVGEKLVRSDINLICFTGSTKTGRAIYEIAASKFIKAVLEMGGSNPGVVFSDVDISKVVPDIYNARFRNCGQVCCALKRLIVHESIFTKITEELKNYTEKRILGNPQDTKTEIGSLSAKRQLELLKDQVNDAISKGAKIVLGGSEPENLSGAYYKPTIVTDVTKKMRIWHEEVFGPVLAIVTFKTEQEAITLANDTKYGLGSKIFTKDLDCARRVAAKIDAGSVEINIPSGTRANNPFGGYKQSGMGRTSGPIGLRELCQIKVISE